MAEYKPLERPRFFSGRLLTAEDLALEQEYFGEKNRRHNRSLHGFGIVSGLEIKSKAGKIEISCGMALDCQGNEIVVAKPQQLSPPANSNAGPTAYLSLQLVEKLSQPVTVAGVAEPTRIAESFEVSFDQENFNRGHQHRRGRWLPCGEAHPLTISRLRRSQQGWRVDRKYRPPVTK